MAVPFHPEQLIEEAQRSTGLERFDSESFREGLDILAADFNATAFTQAGAERLRGDMVKCLANRLKATAYLDARPELRERPVERPVFVFGIPRTGTTLLSNLLAADPARRSPLSWEIDDPVPPPTSTTLYSDPRALSRLEAERQMLAAHPEAGKYYRGSAVYPNECIFFMAHDFKALNWAAFTDQLGYRDWLYGGADMTSAYVYHKRFLQLLQAEAPGAWNLKMPSHALWLETLLHIYPDARLIWIHRDPLIVTASFCSLNTLPLRMSLGEVDLHKVGESHGWQAVQHVQRIMDARARLGEDRILDVHYGDLIRDPILTMRHLYAALGDAFTPEAEAGMQAWLDDNPQDKFGRHEYRLEDYGLSETKLLAQFERYLSRYSVESEG
jgi:hypothetical protein